MAADCSLLLCAAVACFIANPVGGWQSIAEASAVMIPISALPAILWQDRKNFERRDAALTLPWTFVLIALIPTVAVLSTRFRFPLRDALFIQIDRAMGFSIPGMMAWSNAHPYLGTLLDRSYPLIFLLIPVAAILPPLLGKREAAEQFVVANAIAFTMSFPIFTLLPGVGPWAGYHFSGTEAQKACEASIVALHRGADASAAGIVCFPSFHVVWAVLSAWSLQSIKPLRIPSAIVCFLIIVSTMTTGWHYVADVLAGIAVAAVSIACANLVIRKPAIEPLQLTRT